MAVHNRWVDVELTFPSVLTRMRQWRSAAIGVMAAGVGALLLLAVPQLKIDLFAAGAARVAATLLGAGVERSEGVSLIRLSDRTIAVTAGCSGADFFLMVAALLGWRLAREDRPFVRTVLTSLALALPVTLLVNALRVIAVVQAHRWVIPLLPERHGAFAHMATGAAVFLPSLIVLNLVLEYYAKRHRAAGG
jgi:exosortase/archaeosortase family protein